MSTSTISESGYTPSERCMEELLRGSTSSTYASLSGQYRGSAQEQNLDGIVTKAREADEELRATMHRLYEQMNHRTTAQLSSSASESKTEIGTEDSTLVMESVEVKPVRNPNANRALLLTALLVILSLLFVLL